MAKTESGSKIERVVMKLDMYTNNNVGMLRELFPDIRLIASTR